MSKIGKLPVTILEGVTVEKNGDNVIVKGPKGQLSVFVNKGIGVEIKEKEIIISRENEIKAIKSLHGTIRILINNAIIGVTKGFEKKLELVGTGYRAAMQGKNLNISLGFSHPCIVEAMEGIELKIEDQTKITISGIDKQLVGQVAANIRALRPPEPYKGKGIKYEGEVIVKKQGKAASKAE